MDRVVFKVGKEGKILRLWAEAWADQLLPLQEGERLVLGHPGDARVGDTLAPWVVTQGYIP